MTKLLSALVAAVFAVVSLTPVAFAGEMKKGEEKAMEKKDGKAESKKSEEKKKEATPK
jgi:hypothetical protein